MQLLVALHDLNERGFQPTETHVKPWHLHGSKFKPCLALLCQSIDFRTARVGQGKQLGSLVKGFPYCIIQGLTKDGEVIPVIHANNLAMTT